MSNKYVDENLKQYATDKQWEHYLAYCKHGNYRAAAKASSNNYNTIRNACVAIQAKAVQHGYAPDHDLRFPVPDGLVLKGHSTLYDMQTGEAKLQWVKSREDKERQEELFLEAIEAFKSEITPAKAVKGPSKAKENLMACYPVGDHHLGMLAWDEEGTDNYDLSIGERLLFGATENLIHSTPNCEYATIAFLGDFMHYDSFVAQTPTSKNPLDADSRFPKMVRVAIRCMRHMIDTCLKHHKNVHVIVEIGNHDLSSSIFLMEILSQLYENESRISVDTSPKHYHYFSFGKCLVGTHHGHGRKLSDLPLIMATDQPELWGQTEYRYWWTGHEHHDQVVDIQGCKVERFRVLPPTDAWASEKGYRAMRDMKAIILHREFGEVARAIVNPRMLEGEINATGN